MSEVTSAEFSVFSRNAFGFHRQAKHLKLNFVIRQTFFQVVVKPGRPNRPQSQSGQFAFCPTLIMEPLVVVKV